MFSNVLCVVYYWWTIIMLNKQLIPGIWGALSKVYVFINVIGWLVNYVECVSELLYIMRIIRRLSLLLT